MLYRAIQIEIIKGAHSIIMFSQNDQNMGHPPPFLHLFNFGKSPSCKRSKLYINPTPPHQHHHYPPLSKTKAKLCYFIDS